VSPCKPLRPVLIQPILKTLREMATMGLKIKIPSGDIPIVSTQKETMARL